EDYTSPAVVTALLALSGVTDVLPAYDSTLVEYDARALSSWQVSFATEQAGSAPRRDADAALPRDVEIPVAYGGEHGPDLAEVAARAGLSGSEAATLHASATYGVRAVGFAPGFPFMTGVPQPLRAPRLSTPRKSVPAHSVAVAGHQTGVYPVATPGGWNLLGRALVAVYDPHREDPFLVKVGDRVRFTRAAAGQDSSPPAAPTPLSLLPAEPTRPALEVMRPGLHDIVVDAGRYRAGRFGLARGGPLDHHAARLANLLVGNEPDAPLLEMTASGPTLLALDDLVIAVTGPALAPFLGGQQVEGHTGLRLRRGTELAFRPTGVGVRSYLAVAGGLEAQRFMGSASTDARGLLGRSLAAGDVLGVAAQVVTVTGRSFTPAARRFAPYVRSGPKRWAVSVRLVPGPQYEPDAWRALLAGRFEIAAADRVGLRIAGPAVPGGEITSEGIPIGAVQVPPSGDPLVLLNDRGTLGGYTKPAVVHPKDLSLLGQLREGDVLTFRPAQRGVPKT
ncbi:MAG TPA: 5-oxoprolinase subunit PxpB, partial [Trueperaceae bacterium]